MAPASPAAGSHDDGAPDAGDGVPVFRAADVSFRYELWLDAGSIEGVVSWPGGPAGVVTDDNGTPGDPSDDWSPAYVGGDDGDGFLEPGEVWVYSATDRLHTHAGQSYRNYASIPAGGVYDTLDRAAGPQMSSTARRDPAGFEVEPVSADVHFRKLVSDDGSSWVNAQAGAPIAYDPELASESPEAGSHDDGAPDAGDGVPVFRVGADVSFRYELWLDAGSDEGVVSWSGAPDGVVTDDNGTPGDPSDDWSPAYSAGDDGDGFLEPGEVWVYSAPEQKHTREGQSYRNYASIPAGVVYDTLDRGIPVWFSTPRSDPAGFEVVWLNSTTATAADGSHVLNPDGGVITDRVCYGGAVRGVQVTLEGEVLAVGADGTWAEPTGVEGSRRFTPSERSGCVEVEFDVPGDLPGNFVVFEDFKVGGRVVAVHHSVSDDAQSFRQQRRLGLSSEACHAWLTASHDGVASTCDVVVLSSGPEDAGLEVWGTVQAFPLDADGTRLCDSPGPKVEWSVTLDENGAGTVRTPEVVLPPGRWEWIEWGWLPDGRQSGRSCESGVQVQSEMFGVLPAGSQPSGGDPSGGIATTGSDTMTQLRGGAALAAVGLAMVLLASRRVRRRAVDELAG